MKVRNLLDNSIADVSASELHFRISVYGLLEENEQILVQRSSTSNQFSLPGGKIEKGETIKNALVREFKEETGLTIQTIKLRVVKEDFVKFEDNESYHSILIFYDVKRVGGLLGNVHDKEESAEIVFFPRNKILKQKLQEIFLRA